MKKYWKLTLTLTGIIVLFITFTLQKDRPIKELPQYSFNTVEGDSSLLDDLQVIGDTYDMQYNTYTEFKLTEQSFEKFELLPFYKQEAYQYLPNAIEKLKKEDKNFMRQKSFDDLYDINEDYAAFITLSFSGVWYNYNELKVDIKDRKKDEYKEFTLNVKEDLQLNDITLDQMLIVEDYLYLTVTDYNATEDLYDEDIHLLTIDMEEERVIDSQELAHISDDGTGEENYEVDFVHNEEGSQAAMALYYWGEHERELEKVIYFSGNNEKQVLDVSEGDLAAVADDYLIFVNYENGKSSVDFYSLTEEKFTEHIHLDEYHFVDNTVIEKDILYFTAVNDEIETKAALFAYDLYTFEPLYVGEIVPSKTDQRYAMSISALEFIH
ncbi:MAG TPA: hypothetical protein VK075_02510 [Pseudogracilibacillus sp.]|nr:hypothetical protein [Pseudogracilibacillus sp.]